MAVLPQTESAAQNEIEPKSERQSVNGSLPQTTAKQPLQERKLPQETTAKKAQEREPEPAAIFAVVDDLISDDDLAEDFDPFRDVDAKEWRIEMRQRPRKDGKMVMYYNYRRRKIHYVNGKQRVEYLKGGKRVIS